jgi:HD superfamily phosphodiesterase
MGSIGRTIARRLSGLTKSKTFNSSPNDGTSNTSGVPPTTPTKSKTAPITEADLSVSPLNKALPPPPTDGDASPIAIISTLKTDCPLLDLDRLAIPLKDRVWFTTVNIAVRRFTNNLDASHNYQHIRRVVSNALVILEKEKKHHIWARTLDPMIIWVACMTHHVGHVKYRSTDGEHDQATVIDEFLKENGCPLPVRRQAAYLAARVSFTAEMSDEEEVKAFATEYPAFRIVQDADRLDGLGAVGISRLFVHGGIDQTGRRSLFDSGVRLVEGRLSHYLRLMKTESGRKMTEERYKWMVEEFVGTWKTETDTSNI